MCFYEFYNIVSLNQLAGSNGMFSGNMWRACSVPSVRPVCQFSWWKFFQNNFLPAFDLTNFIKVIFVEKYQTYNVDRNVTIALLLNVEYLTVYSTFSNNINNCLYRYSCNILKVENRSKLTNFSMKLSLCYSAHCFCHFRRC